MIARLLAFETFWNEMKCPAWNVLNLRNSFWNRISNRVFVGSERISKMISENTLVIKLKHLKKKENNRCYLFQKHAETRRNTRQWKWEKKRMRNDHFNFHWTNSSSSNGKSWSNNTSQYDFELLAHSVNINWPNWLTWVNNCVIWSLKYNSTNNFHSI